LIYTVGSGIEAADIAGTEVEMVDTAGTDIKTLDIAGTELAIGDIGIVDMMFQRSLTDNAFQQRQGRKTV